MTRALVVFAASATVLAVYGCWCDWHARRWRERCERLTEPRHPAESRDLETEAAEAERNAVLCVELALLGDDINVPLCLNAMELMDAAIEAREAADAALEVEMRERML